MYELQDNFRLLIQELLKMEDGAVRPHDFNQPSEGESFAMVQLSDIRPLGMYSHYIDDDGVRHDCQYVELTFTFDFFGINASLYASKLNLMMQTPYASEEMQKLGMGFSGCSSAKNLTALELERLERYQVKMTVNYIVDVHDVEVQYGNFEVIKINLIAEP